MENKCQHLTMTQRNELLQLLNVFEEFFNRKLGTWTTNRVEFELREDTKAI